MNLSDRKRFRARLAVIEAKEAERLVQRREREEWEKRVKRIDALKMKPEFELTPREILELEENVRADPLYSALKAYERGQRKAKLEGDLRHEAVPNPCPACRTTFEQPALKAQR